VRSAISSPGHGRQPIHVQVLLRRPDLPGVEEQQRDRAVMAHQLLDLPVGEIREPLPFLRFRGRVVVGVAGVRGPGRVPVVGVVPIGLGKIDADAEAFLAEGVEDRADRVGLGVGMERAIGRRNLVIRELRVEHAEAVVVLRRIDDVLHAGILGGLRPGARVELGGIEGLGQQPVIVLEPLEFLVSPGPGLQVVGPGPLVLFHQRPRLDAAPLAVSAEVHHESELQILELLEFLRQPGLGERRRLLSRPGGRGKTRQDPQCHGETKGDSTDHVLPFLRSSGKLAL
jgi:hypothetical protein